MAWPGMGGMGMGLGGDFGMGMGPGMGMSAAYCDDPELQAKLDRLRVGDLSVLKEAEDKAKRECEERERRKKDGASGVELPDEEELDVTVKNLGWLGDDESDAIPNPNFKGFSWGAPNDFKDITADNPLVLVSREEWGAVPAKEGLEGGDGGPLEWPVENVVLFYRSECPPCADRQECQLRMRELQAHHMADDSMSDIPYNFMIDLEGVVYEGRGWGVKSSAKLQDTAYPAYTSHRLDVCMIGDYTTYIYPQKAVNAVLDLARAGVDKGYISGFAEFWDWREGFHNDP